MMQTHHDTAAVTVGEDREVFSTVKQTKMLIQLEPANKDVFISRAKKNVLKAFAGTAAFMSSFFNNMSQFSTRMQAPALNPALRSPPSPSLLSILEPCPVSTICDRPRPPLLKLCCLSMP